MATWWGINNDPMGTGPEVYYYIQCDFSSGVIIYTALFKTTASWLGTGAGFDISVSANIGGNSFSAVTIKDSNTSWDVRSSRYSITVNGSTYYYTDAMVYTASGYSFPSGTFDMSFTFSRGSGSGSGDGTVYFSPVTNSGSSSGGGDSGGGDSGGGDSGGGDSGGGDSGGGDTSSWKLWDRPFPSNLSYDESYDSPPYKKSVSRWRVSFAKSGMATFYSSGSTYMHGWLDTNSENWSSSNGRYSNAPLAYDDNHSGGYWNFSFSFYVNAGKEYYLFTAPDDADTFVNTTINIKPPTGSNSPKWFLEDTYDLGTVSNSTNPTTCSPTLSSYGVSRIAVKFAKSGTAIIYSTGSADTVGFLSTNTGFNSSSGNPSSYITYNDDGGDNYNFKIETSVTAGTTYYIFSRFSSSSSSGSYTVNVTLPPTYTVTYSENGSNTGTATFPSGGGVTLKRGQDITVSTNSTTYTLTPNANGGTASGTGTTTVTTTRTKPFTSWYSSSNSMEYYAGETYGYISDTTMTAQYGTETSSNSYRHSFTGITVTPPASTSTDYCKVYMNQNYDSAESSMLAQIQSTKSYSLKGWYTAASGGTKYSSSSPTVSSDTTIYAQYNSSTSIGSVTLPALERPEYTLLGYSTDQTATSATYTAGTSYTPSSTDDVTLYAIWEPNGVDGDVYIYANGEYKAYQAYIYTNGAWVRHKPYVYHNEEFKEVTI